MIIYDIGNISDWLTAIGTISAVVVALYLSRRDRKPSAKVSASLGHIVDNHGVSKHPVHMTIEIVNQGLIPIHLSEATIQLNSRSNERMIFLDGSHRVDKLLKPGEFYEHKLNYQDIRNYYKNQNKRKLKTYAFYMDASGKKYRTKARFYF
ncbi:MAG TPA: hypothetical protein K8V56_21465 [Sporosarcina psychrophila]|uniref:Uncharacterized protein n=1 Tax=Sporosarcina psychrophila TaxID=1476 RepID=A0A921G2W8_SPOPS|nr:hypothetical protein [Sporosarcina psychrophila]